MRFSTQLALCAALAAPLAAQTRTTPEEALSWLKKGNERFLSEQIEARPLGEGVRRTLAKGQHPFAIVWTCSDSRVAPEHLFQAGLGELFVVRTAGNACDPESLASVEYAAEHLAAPLLVVLGHDKCGAVKAAVDDAKASPAIRRVLERIAPAVQRAKKDGFEGDTLTSASVQENVYETVSQAQLRSATLRELVRLHRLQVVGARYHLDTGAVEWLPERGIAAEKPAASARKKPPAALPPHTVLAMLQAGHRRYLSGNGGHPDLSLARRQELANGQNPAAVVVTCADSRVAPEHVFDSGLGEIFVVRVAGNVLNDSVQASVEYAVEHLGASLIVWMGHDQCGAVKAALASDGHGKVSESMRRLLERLEPAVERAKRFAGEDELLARSIQENVLRSLQELRKNSTVVQELEEKGKLGIVPVVYRLESGDLAWLDEAQARKTAREPREDHGTATPAAPAGETTHAAPGEAPSAGATVHERHPRSHASETKPSHAEPDARDTRAEQSTGHGDAHPPMNPATTVTGTLQSSRAEDTAVVYGTLGIALLAGTLGVVVIWSLQRKKQRPADTSAN